MKIFSAQATYVGDFLYKLSYFFNYQGYSYPESSVDSYPHRLREKLLYLILVSIQNNFKTFKYKELLQKKIS